MLNVLVLDRVGDYRKCLDGIFEKSLVLDLMYSSLIGDFRLN